jgi:cephalosporin hydroxylase
VSIVTRGLRTLHEEGIKTFTKKALSYLFRKSTERVLGYAFYPFIVRKFKSSIRNINDVYEAIEFAFSHQVFGISIKPIQIKHEITSLLKIIAELKPKVVLEIGTEKGGTLFLFTRVADPKAKIISIDLPGGPFGGGYPRWKIPLYKSFAKEGQEIYLIRGDSHNIQTFEKVKRILNGEKVEFLFIDGDHTYEGVKKDFEMYSPLVRRGGIIAFHDIVVHPPETKCEVNKFWNEVKYKYKWMEIVENQGWAGIGILYV